MKAKLDVRPDTLDFRDQMFVPTLVDTPIALSLEEYQELGIPILDQGKEGACTGFGLATTIHYLLQSRLVVPDKKEISPWMLYTMAKRYDEWPGEDYDGSSARGAMKGWHKHGVCRLSLWPAKGSNKLTYERVQDATQCPLGAYFRVNHKELVAMHTALAEVGILFATALVHSGWNKVGLNGMIELDEQILGGHAFAIVGYEKEGFWIQNSWGKKWGHNGFGLLTYADWLKNGADVWVARLGVPVELGKAKPKSATLSMSVAESLYVDVRPHIVTLGNDGVLSSSGTYGTSKDEIKAIFQSDIPRITKGWKKKRIVLWAHGGLVSEQAAIHRVSEYREAMLDKQTYLLGFNWRSDYWTTLKNILQDAVRRRRPEGFLDATKDFMLNRLDDAIEPMARLLTGYAQWKEMQENTLRASTHKNGGVRFTLDQLAELARKDPSVEIHLIGHSAGSVLLAPAIQYLATKGQIKTGPMKGKKGLGLQVVSCTLWAPACSIELFKESYSSLLGHTLDHFTLFTLTDELEREDQCLSIYHKSLLYLISAAFGKHPRIPFIREGTPILGMEKFINKDPSIKDLFKQPYADWILTPNTAPVGSFSSSRARRHGDFDDDEATVSATLARILNKTFPSFELSLNQLLPETMYSRRNSL